MGEWIPSYTREHFRIVMNISSKDAYPVPSLGNNMDCEIIVCLVMYFKTKVWNYKRNICWHYQAVNITPGHFLFLSPPPTWHPVNPHLLDSATDCNSFLQRRDWNVLTNYFYLLLSLFYRPPLSVCTCVCNYECLCVCLCFLFPSVCLFPHSGCFFENLITI